ncbi:MAG TPA: LysR family transcriptional regulator [Bordetella sp.]|uniref:LysR family transcriptional regulator n=1 Tax=Bordetella sp. TaxID=28081 RepID=UPI002ED08718
MRLDWIEDIIAVLHAGSLNRAAESRHLTQPAFSRRIQSIEEYVGVELLDRTRKPAQLSDAVLSQQQKLEQLASGLRDLLYELRHYDRQVKNRVVIASQHAITTSVAPTLVKQIAADPDSHIRLRSANRSECLTLLMTKQADVILIYRSPDEALPIDGAYLDKIDFGEELFVPVFASHALEELNAQYNSGELPIITYPPNVFLGEVIQREILPKLRTRLFLKERTESALTLAVLQLALAGVGVAWIPQSLAAKEISYGNLTELGHLFGSAKLRIDAVRLSGEKSEAEQNVWAVIGAAANRHRVP